MIDKTYRICKVAIVGKQTLVPEMRLRVRIRHGVVLRFPILVCPVVPAVAASEPHGLSQVALEVLMVLLLSAALDVHGGGLAMENGPDDA